MSGAGRRLLCGVIVVLLIITLPLATSANDGKIIPGERIGDASLNMSVDDILKTLGAPSKVERQQKMTGYAWTNLQLRVFQSLDTGFIVSIHTYWTAPTSRGDRTVTSQYRTDNGLGIGSTPEEVRRAYGDAGCVMRDRSSPQGNTRSFFWSEQGIFFIVATDLRFPEQIRNRVREIGVQRKGPLRDAGSEFVRCSP